MRTGARWGVGWAGGAVCGARRTVAGTRRAVGRTGGTVCCSPACTKNLRTECTEQPTRISTHCEHHPLAMIDGKTPKGTRTSGSQGLNATRHGRQSILETCLRGNARDNTRETRKGRTRTCGAVRRAGRRVARTRRAVARRRRGVRCSEGTKPLALVNTAGLPPYHVRQAPGGSALVPAVMLHRSAGALLAPHSPCLRQDWAHAGSALKTGAPWHARVCNLSWGALPGLVGL